MNPAFRATGWTPRRGFWVAVHRYFGLATAIFIAVAALTGSILAFRAELKAWIIHYALNIQSCSLAMNPVSRNRPTTMIMAAAPTSTPFMTSVPLPDRESVIRPARSRA